MEKIDRKNSDTELFFERKTEDPTLPFADKNAPR